MANKNLAFVKLTYESVNAADYIVDFALTKGGKKLYSKYLDGRFPGYMAAKYATLFDQVASEELRYHDTGEKIDSLISGWVEEEPPVIDSSLLCSRV